MTAVVLEPSFCLLGLGMARDSSLSQRYNKFPNIAFEAMYEYEESTIKIRPLNQDQEQYKQHTNKLSDLSKGIDIIAAINIKVRMSSCKTIPCVC
jgi:hypothetical protein